jgi:hypothetical protein
LLSQIAAAPALSKSETRFAYAAHAQHMAAAGGANSKKIPRWNFFG